MNKNILYIICMILIFSSLTFAVDTSGNPTTWWDSFVDDFFNLFGVKPELQFNLEKHNPLGDKQEYLFKTSIDNKDKYFDYEVKVISKSANIETWLEYYEERECSEEVFDYVDYKKGKNGTAIFKTEYYDCSKWIIVTKKEARQKLLKDNDFSKIKVKRGEWGECPKENRIYMPEGIQPTWTCEQEVDVIITYAGRKHIEWATWTMDSASGWSGIHYGTKESGGNIIVSAYLDYLTAQLDNNTYISYQFEDGDSTQVVANAGTSGDGTALANAEPTADTGLIGNSVYFDGSDDYIQMTDLTNNFKNEGGWEFWFKSSLVSPDGSMAYMLDMNGEMSFLINSTNWAPVSGCKEDTGCIFFKDAGGDFYIPVNFTDKNKWTHIAFTWDNSGRWIYLDGVVIYSDADSDDMIIGALTNNRLGCERNGQLKCAVGNMDMFYLSDRLITPTEIASAQTRTAGSFVTNSFFNGSESVNLNVFEHYNTSGDVEIFYCTNNDNSTCTDWNLAHHMVDLGVDDTKYAFYNLTFNTSTAQAVYINQSYLTTRTAPSFDPVSNITDKIEDFGTFQLDLSGNISDTVDGDGDLKFTWVNNNSNLMTLDIDNSTDVATFTSKANASGSVDFNIIVWNTGVLQNSTYFAIEVAGVNDQPWWDMIDNDTITIIEDTASQDAPANMSIYYWDVEDGNVFAGLLFIDTNETDVTCTESGIAIQCSPVNNFTGRFTLEVEGDDGVNPVIVISYEAEVTAVNNNPWWHTELRNITLDEDFLTQDNLIPSTDFDANFSDIEENNNPTTYEISYWGNSSTRCNFDGTNNWDCNSIANQTATDTYRISLNDSGGLSAEFLLQITINAINDQPWIDPLSDITMNEDNGTSTVFTGTELNESFRDVEEDQTASTITILSETNITLIDCSLETDNDLTCVTVSNQSGTSDITLNFTDSGGLSITDTFKITVSGVNDAPTTPQIATPFTHNYYFSGVCENSTDEEGDDINYNFMVDTSNPPSTSRQNTTNSTYNSDSFTNGTLYFMCDANDASLNSTPTSIITYSYDTTPIWNYSVEVDPTLSQGATTDYYLNITYNNLSGYVTDVTATIEYDGNEFGMGKTTTDSNQLRFSRENVVIPLITTREVLFAMAITYINGSVGVEKTANFTQTISSFGVGNCVDFKTEILNYTLFDEEDKTKITTSNLTNTSIEVDITLSSIDNPSVIWNYSKINSTTNILMICVQEEILNNTNYSLDATARYYSDERVVEYNYIQKYLLTNTGNPQNINLYDLKTADSTSFLVEYKDEFFLPVQDAVIDLQRKYIGEGIFLSVEHGLTDVAGQTVLHLVTEEIVYKFIIRKAGVILYTSSELLALCQSVPCEIKLQDSPGIETREDWGEIDNLQISLTLNESSRTVTLDFVTTDGSTAEMFLEVTLSNAYFNDTACSDTQTSSSGTLTCIVPEALTNTTYIVNVTRGSEFIAFRMFNLNPDPTGIFGKTSILMTVFLFLTLTFMAVGSGIAMIVFGIIGLILATYLTLFTGGVIGAGASILWLIIAGAIIIWKIGTRRKS